MIRDIINDINNLRGSEVRIFGQVTKLDSEVGRFTIDIIDVLNALDTYEIDTEYLFDIDTESEEIIAQEISEAQDASEVLDILYNYGYLGEEIKSDNSYNWSTPVSNNFNFRVYEDTMGAGIFVEFSVHRFGDVRCNYTDSALLHLDSFDEFLEVLSECNKHEEIEVNEIPYNVDVNIFSVGFEVFDYDGCYVCTAYGCDEDYIIEDATNKIIKEIEAL